MFWFFGHKACGILVPWSGINSAPPALEVEVLTTGPPGKPQDSLLFKDRIIFHCMIYRIFFIHYLLMDIWVVSMSWLLWIMIQWTQECRFFLRFWFLFFFFAKYPKVGLLDHTIIIFLIFWETSILFSIVIIPFYIPINSVLIFAHPHHLLSFTFLLMDIVTGVRWSHGGFDLHFPDN